jgi:hypothetical protein
MRLKAKREKDRHGSTRSPAARFSERPALSDRNPTTRSVTGTNRSVNHQGVRHAALRVFPFKRQFISRARICTKGSTSMALG